MSECALICIISFLSFFSSQFSARFCPEKLNHFLFLAAERLPCWSKDVFFQLCPLAASPRPDSLTGHPVMAPEPSWEQWECCYSGSAGEGMPAQPAPLVPPRQPGLCHTQSAYVGRHRAASREPTKQKGSLLLPNIMSLCSACLIRRPAARVHYSLFLALPHQQDVCCQGRWALHHTRTQSPALGEVRARSPTVWWAGRYLDVQAAPVTLQILKHGDRAAGAAGRGAAAEQTCPVAAAVPHCHT